MVVVDAWKGFKHGIAGNHPDKCIILSDFVGRLCYDLLYNKRSQNRASPASDLSPLAPINQPARAARAATRQGVPSHVLFDASPSARADGSTVSVLTPPAECAATGCGTNAHVQIKNTKRRRCGALDPSDPCKKRKCGSLTYIMCATCNVPCCNPHTTERNCWEMHEMGDAINQINSI